MADLVTRDEVKTALRYDGTDFDALIDAYIPAASSAVVEYLKWTEADYVTSGAVDDTLEGVDRAKIAAISLIGYMLENPASDPDKVYGHGTLPWFVTAMLYPLRDPTFA